MRLKYKIVIIFLICCLGIQIYKPYKNIQKEATESDFLIYEKAPEDVANLYKNACYDCHSNYTRYEWFDNIAPVSWYINNNVKRGIFGLNFSNWENLPIIQKEIMFSAIPFNINTDRMPSKNYKMFHSEAELSDEDKVKMIKWLAQVKARFLREEHE